MEGPFADDRTSVLPPSSCRVRGTWQGGRGGGTGGGVGVLRARRCQVKRVFITNVKGTFFGMSESEEASKRR